MKKVITTLIASLLVVMMAASLIACGKPSGTYKLYEINYKAGDVDITVNVDDIEDSEDLPEEAKLALLMFTLMTLEFDGDEITMKMGILGNTTSKFKMDGNKIIIEEDEDENQEDEDEDGFGEITYKGGKVIFYIEDEGMEMQAIFKK